MNTRSGESVSAQIGKMGVIDLTNGNFSLSAAVGLFQNVVGLVLTLGTNAVVKKINPENAMY